MRPHFNSCRVFSGIFLGVFLGVFPCFLWLSLFSILVLQRVVELQGGIWVEKVSILIIKASRAPTLY